MGKLRKIRHITIVGLVWFAIFGASVLLIGRALSGIVKNLSERIMRESIHNCYNDLASEFERTNQLEGFVADFVERQTTFDTDTYEPLAHTVMSLDTKVDAFWISDSNETLRFGRGGQRSRSEGSQVCCDSLRLGEGGPYQSFAFEVRSVNKKYVVGIDVLVSDLHRMMVDKTSEPRGYVVLTNGNHQVLLHPDTAKLCSDLSSDHLLIDAAYRGQTNLVEASSSYLDVPVWRQYSRLEVLGTKLVVMVSVPLIVVSEELDMFHTYSFVIIAIALGLFLLLLVVFQVVLQREFRLRNKAEREAANLQLEQVVGKIDQHFLFNCFNSLYSLIGRDTALAREFVLSLSKVYRHVLEKGKEPMSSLDKELKFMQEYYFLQKIRFGNTLDLKIDVEDDLKELCVPSMSIQMLVENAIKHNIITDAQPLHISIYAQSTTLVVENNLAPRPDIETKSFGIGLERIRSIYGQYTHTQMVVSQQDGKFVCKMPLVACNNK